MHKVSFADSVLVLLLFDHSGLTEKMALKHMKTYI